MYSPASALSQQVLPDEHPRLGLEEGWPGGLPQWDQVWDVGPVVPGPWLLHPGQQHDHRQQHHHQSRDAQVRFNGNDCHLVASYFPIFAFNFHLPRYQNYRTLAWQVINEIILDGSKNICQQPVKLYWQRPCPQHLLASHSRRPRRSATPSSTSCWWLWRTGNTREATFGSTPGTGRLPPTLSDFSSPSQAMQRSGLGFIAGRLKTFIILNDSHYSAETFL